MIKNILIFILLLKLPVFGAVNTPLLIQGQNKFAVELYTKLKEDSHNLFFSPYGISSTLAMVYSGAQNETKDQMQKVLHYLENIEDNGATFKQVNHSLMQHLDLRIANSLWFEDYIPLKPEFTNLINQDFNGSLFKLDFINQLDTNRYKINKWVSMHTSGRINDIVQPQDLSPATKLLIVAAIYFQSAWKTPFDTKLTKLAPFYLDAHRSHQVSTMHHKGVYQVSEIPNGTLLQLTYLNKKELETSLALWIFVPQDINGLSQLEYEFSLEKFESWKQKVRSREVNLSMPKIHLDQTFSLNEILKDMGLTTAFSRKADFSNISDSQDLYINKVMHKAYLAIDEKGTEAAAATTISLHPTAVISHEPVLDLKVDRPFFFLITDESTGAILFMGRLAVL